MENELFICQCGSVEHQLIFSYFPDEKIVYMSVHLIPHGFWKRLKEGIKYIFGHRSIYGYFDEFIFNEEDADRLQEIVNHLKKCV